MTIYSAAPLTHNQRAEVLRVMSDCAVTERHNYRVHLEAERRAALAEIKQAPEREPELRATAAAFDRALELLHVCWPTAALEAQIKAAA